MRQERFSYPGNVMRVVITGTISPLGNHRISWIQFLGMSQTKKSGLLTRKRTY
jgi:hypothetical protein